MSIGETTAMYYN